MSVALVHTPRAAGPHHHWFIYVAVALFGGLLTFADFGELLAEETKKWAKVIRAANIKAE